MPVLTVTEEMLRHLSTSSSAMLANFGTPVTRNPFPIAAAIKQIASDRLAMAGDHLRAGDQLVRQGAYRASISRHYYAMYHTARAVVFAEVKGDDHQRHNVLARHLPTPLPQRSLREAQLTDARLLRNEADYECYPLVEQLWARDAQSLMVIASEFVGELEEFALAQGLV